MPTASEYLGQVFCLQDRVAVVTGGMGKLGTEITSAFAKAGAKVAVLDISAEPNEILKGLAEKYPIRFFALDITNAEEVEKAIDAVSAEWGMPNILVNNAGWKASPNAPTKGGVPFEQYPMEVWKDVFRLNMTAAAVCAQAVGKRLIADQRPGVIINMLSVYAVVAPDQRIYAHINPPFVKDAAYGASKAALLALTRDLAVQWAPHNIRVVAISPGGVENPNADPEFKRKYQERVPLGRMARIDEISGAILFLASDAASYITGENLMVDGGLSIW